MYNVMGAAKASLEANVRYNAAELAPKASASTRFRRADQDARRRRHQGFSQHAVVGREGFRTQAQRSPSRKSANAAAFLCSDLASGITQRSCTSTPVNIMGFSSRRKKNPRRRRLVDRLCSTLPRRTKPRHDQPAPHESARTR